MKFEDNSDAPEARRETLPKTFTSSKKKTRLHSTRPEEWVCPVAETKEPEERDFCGGFRSQNAHGQQVKALTLLSWRP